jgi:hypothetical protein
MVTLSLQDEWDVAKFAGSHDRVPNPRKTGNRNSTRFLNNPPLCAI